MRLGKNRQKFFSIIVATILISTFTLVSLHYSTVGTFIIASPDPGLTITTQTDKQTYLLRQKVITDGNITIDDIPGMDLVVNVQINNPLDVPILYRTLQVGTPTQTWPINITELSLTDTGNNPINTAKTGSSVIAGISLHNWQLTERTIYGTITVFDANTVPIATHFVSTTLDPHQSTTSRFLFQVPKWACSGKALIVGNVYSKEPRTGGIALSLEKTEYYCISRKQQGLKDLPTLPPPPPQNTPGKYKTILTLPPDPRAGTYNLYVVGHSSPITISSASTTFSVEDSSGYPPQASFVFWPSEPYLNMTVSFDASSSSPEGFDDEITKYEWDFGDGTPNVIKTGNPPSATTSHDYMQAGTFMIMLNATDDEGLWSTTSKSIEIIPESGPTANFTWTPTIPYDNDFVTFNASDSTTGWCAETQSFSPIQNYTWNFDDGTGNITTTNKTITHMFGHDGNFTVYLTVVDACERSNYTSHVVEVLNSTGIKMYDLDGNGIIDLKDVFRVALAYGSFPGHPRWDPACDFNNDDKVDLKDYYPIALHYGEDP